MLRARAYGWLNFLAAATLLPLTVSFIPPQLAAAQLEARSGFSAGQAYPSSVAVADFDRDGILDAATVNFSASSTVDILMGNGDGTFRLGQTYPAPGSPFQVIAASLRHNGLVDLVIAGGGSDNAVYIMIGNGDGTFQPAIPYPTTAESFMAALGDFMGNGNLDIVTVEGTSAQGVRCNCVEVLPGNGDGTFGAPITTPVPYDVDGIAVAPGDFNNDGKLDVAVAGDYQVDILLGNGKGAFSPDGYYAVSATPQSIATGYFTSNKKKLDLAVANTEGESVSVLLGNGDGTFQQAVFYDVASPPTWLIAQDMNGDGKLDLITSNSGQPGELQAYPPGVTVLDGNGDGTFQQGVFYPAGNAFDGNYVAAGDFNGDHKPDLAFVDLDGSTVITLLNTGVASFSPTTPLNFQKQVVGTVSKAKTVRLTNTGASELKIQSMKASAEFAVTSMCGSRVAPGAQCTIHATFAPTRKGVVQGTISIIDNASSKPQVIELLGDGT
jgi:Abnormal spindle-like microcephaly-assoc'd, ASPM-SPD-2-Hydin/FG-GAP-like repeat